MRALSIEFYDFRNLAPARIELDGGVTLFYGDNGQGKSNILEGIWLMSGGKSFRSAPDKEMIAFGSDRARVTLTAADGPRKVGLEARLERGRRKEFYEDGQKLPRVTDLLGRFPTVLFEPDHLKLVKEGPEHRRRFLDISLCQQSRGYCAALRDYGRLLDRRGALLKQIAAREQPAGALDVWDEALAVRAGRIGAARYGYIRSLLPEAQRFMSELSGGAESLDLTYDGQTPEDTPQAMAQSYLELLARSRGEDIRFCTTGCGIHREDMTVLINGVSAKKYGSSGQKRSAVLALKLAEGAVAASATGMAPVFLLDDVLSELDAGRRAYIQERISAFQVIVTDCGRFDFSVGRAYRVTAGRVEEM